MRSKLVVIINGALALIGGSLLVLSVYELHDFMSRPDSERDYLVSNDSISFEEVVSIESERSENIDVEIIFVSPSEYCASVLNDIEDYKRKIEKAWGEELSIRMWLAVTGTDSADYLRFTTTSMLKINYWSVESPVTLRQLEKFGSANVSQQIIIFNRDTNNVVYRARLRRGMPASEALKNRILNDARGYIYPTG